jgi:hypothetical protein
LQQGQVLSNRISPLPARRKYKLLRPRIAKTFEVMTINESVVIAKMAGMESSANTRSVISTITRATSIGEAKSTPFLCNKNLLPFTSNETGINLSYCNIFFISIFFSFFCRSIRIPVNNNNPPNTYIIQWTLSSKETPARINPILIAIALKIPAIRTLC